MGPLVALFVAGLLFLRPEPIDQAVVFGCYSADHAPNLSVGAKIIRIAEPDRRTLRYVAEPSKDGYDLQVEPALALSPEGDGKLVFKETVGSGFFWQLLPAGERSGLRLEHPSEYGGRFRMYATNGKEVTYSRISRVACS